MLSLLYSTALFLSNSAEAPRAPAYAPSFCRRTDCNCSPYRTASTQQNTLARRPLRPFPPAATPVALALLSTRSPVNTHAPSLGFSSRRRQPAFLPAAAPVANRSLIYVLTCHNTHTESRFLFTPSRRFPLPSRAHNFHPENTLACRPLRPFPPAATPVALALLSTRSPVNTHAPSLGFSSRRRQPAFLPAAMPVALALLSMSSPVTTCADSRFLFTPLRRLKLPSRTHGFYTANTLSRRRPLPFRLPLHRL